MTKAVPHPKAPTIDHIIPLAHGGDDTRANVQLAHFLCNASAGITGTKQAALFG
jgi:5-methylcytosine-specific restriction endonuclease McrA